jgi:hypothetical protein
MYYAVSGAAYRSRLISSLCDLDWPARLLTPMCLILLVTLVLLYHPPPPRIQFRIQAFIHD